MHPKSVPSTFLLEATRIKDASTDSPDKQILGANGIPRGCMSFPQEPPLHLLRQAWNQLHCFGASLSQYVSRQSRWILKQHCNADIKGEAKRI
jgi:hypothetical protein